MIEIKQVQTKKERKIFLTFPWKIYRNDPLWVPPILGERRKTTDPARGVFFQRGEADFFIAWDKGKPVGTICAAVDPPTNAFRGKKECIFGFFEYIRDYAVFKALIQKAAEWGRARGLNQLYGPWNLDYEDSYGVLLEGRDRPPAIMCGHTPPYYREYMEEYGFKPARANNVALEIDLTAPKLKRLEQVANRLRKKGHIKVRQADFDKLDEEIGNLHRLLNLALAHLDDTLGWRRDQLETFLEPLRKIADPELILFADVNGETVGFLPGLPNLNEALIHANGLRYPWDYLSLLWHMRKQPKCLAVKSVLVLPQYWNTGVGVILFDELRQRAVKKGYQWADLSITSADNPNTIILAKHLGAKIYKRWQVYRLDI